MIGLCQWILIVTIADDRVSLESTLEDMGSVEGEASTNAACGRGLRDKKSRNISCDESQHGVVGSQLCLIVLPLSFICFKC